MKILHILATPRAEGTPNLVLDWLALPGYEQEVFVLHGKPADLTVDLRHRAAWYKEDDLFHGHGWRKFLRIVTSVREVCRDRRPELVVCWIAGLAQWISAGVRWAQGGKPALLIHSGNPPTRNVRGDCLSRFVLLPVWLLGAKCVCCSNYVRDLYRSVPGLPDALFASVYNCVRAEEVGSRVQAARAVAAQCLPLERSPVGIMVATLEAHKDHGTLLRALPTVVAKHPNFRMLLVGNGTLRSELETLTSRLKLGDSVKFLGTRRDVPELLAQSDLFIFSTTPQEGLGSVLLEALAAGLPIVASDCPACREVLADGRFGTLVMAGDPTALATGILQKLEARDFADAEASSAYANSFTAERMVHAYLELAGLNG